MHEIANRDIMSARKPENCLQISGKRRMLIPIAAPAAYIKRVQEEISMNEVMNNILTRRSIRKFTDTPISREILDDLVQAALHAPSGMGKQTWKFTVVTNKNAIKRLAEAIKTTLNRPGYDLYCPAAIIIPSNLRDSNWGKEDDACALENIFLAANSYGVGSVWINQLQNICDTPAIRDILNDFGVPANHVVYGMAALGYPDPDTVIQPKERIGKVAYIE